MFDTEYRCRGHRRTERATIGGVVRRTGVTAVVAALAISVFTTVAPAVADPSTTDPATTSATTTVSTTPVSTAAAPTTTRAPTTTVSTTTAGTAATSAAGTSDKSNCPDIHVIAVQATSQSGIDAPETQDTGELSSVVLPVLNAAQAQGFTVERTYVPYPAAATTQGVSAAYKSSVVDGYNRLTQVAARVVYQCPDTKLIVLGNSQGGQAVSLWAQQIAAGKGGEVTADHIALVVTFGDPTRGAGAPLFPGRAAQVGPAPWQGLDSKTNPSATLFPDLYTSPTGQGIGPERDIAADFGALDGRVAQWCIEGDLSCSAPKSISLARAALAIAGQSDLDFSRDPFGVATTLAAATLNTVGNGLATFADKDIKGASLADVYFDGSASISKRLEEAADPTNAATQTNPLVGVLKVGQIFASSLMSFLGSTFDSKTLGSLISAGATVLTSAVGAGVTGMAAGPEAAVAAALAAGTVASTSLVSPVVTLASNAATAALNIIPPQSGSKKVSSVFDLLINEVKANADLPALLADARLWNQSAVYGGYHTARVAVDGSTPADITADWVIAAGRDYHAAAMKKKPQPKPAPADATPPTAKYDHGPDGKITAPAPAPGSPDLTSLAKFDTPGDVRMLTAPGAVKPQPASPAAVTWLADATTPIAQRLAADEDPGPAGTLLRTGSPLLLALTAREKTT